MGVRNEGVCLLTDMTCESAMARALALPRLLPAVTGHVVRVTRAAPRRHVLAGALGLCGLALAASVFAGLSARDARANVVRDRHADLVAAAANGFSDAQLAALMANAGPGAERIAARVGDGGVVEERLGAVNLLDLLNPPVLQLKPADADEAARLNAAIPVSTAYNPVARPFGIDNRAERAQALDCLTAAVYYEAANEPRESQEGVAQVVLNRVRHPAYPKSVCGVVFQGSERDTGCQFSFTCDGSMARNPARWAWTQSRDVAEKALDGYVMPGVGSATHYHANYVMPYWGASLVKVAQYGLHIFYRPAGPALLNGRYDGDEARFSRVSLIGKARPKPLLTLETAASAAAGFKTPAPTPFLEAAQTPQGRMHAVIAAAGGAYATHAPMHEMVAMRAAMLREARERSATPPPVAPAQSPAGAGRDAG
jgi:hypothetical protein